MRRVSVFCLTLLLSACGSVAMQAPPQSASGSSGAPTHLHLESGAQSIWGGDATCRDGVCLLALVLHADSKVALYRLQGRSVVRLGEATTAYHPDGSRWLSDGRLAVAVEIGGTVDLFRVEEQGLERVSQVAAPFAPRDVVVADFDGDGIEDMIVTPYAGNTIGWIRGLPGGGFAPGVAVPGCATPWHPRVLRSPSGRPDVIAACLDDRTLTRWENLGSGQFAARTLARFDHPVRDVALSPDGSFAWVAAELGGAGYRVDLRQDPPVVERIPAPGLGYVAAGVLRDGTVVWGGDRRVVLQRLRENGEVESRQLPVAGFASPLQVLDLDGDGQDDLIVYNSSGQGADVWFGPLWTQAIPAERREGR